MQSDLTSEVLTIQPAHFLNVGPLLKHSKTFHTGTKATGPRRTFHGSAEDNDKEDWLPRSYAVSRSVSTLTPTFLMSVSPAPEQTWRFPSPKFFAGNAPLQAVKLSARHSRLTIGYLTMLLLNAKGACGKPRAAAEPW